ncbi:MAG TPA: ABC transporter substrate-binding protein [Candidatus Limnocylindrales bacterium]|nr:ABC transporter substrate-binding protein [Candidatus Limnocylindrales bacterium]
MLRYRSVAFVAALVLAASACTTAASSPSAAPVATPGESAAASQPAGSPAVQIKEGGTIIVGLPGDMVLADPTLVSDSNSSYIMENVIQGLVGLKPGTTSDVEPVLASAMPTVSADGLTYTFTLRSGIKFHDGTALDSTAVKYNYDRQKNAPAALQDSYNYYYGAVFGWGANSNITSIDTPDPMTVVFHLAHPQSNFLLATTLPQFGIQSPTALQAGDADNPDPSKSAYAQGTGGTGKSMVGTGPFMFKEWQVGDHVTLVKNPNYWDPNGVAHLDSIIYKPYADQTAELNALQSGDIDFAQTINPNDVKTVQADSTLQAIDRGASCNEGLLQLNQSDTQSASAAAAKPAIPIVDPAAHKLNQNPMIRQAIMYALNRQSYVDAFYADLAKPADNWMPPSTEYYKALNLPTYDVQKAKDLIAASGVAAADLKTTLYYPSDVARPYMPNPKGLAEAIATDLEAVGFQVQFGTAGWHAGYLTDEAVGTYPMWLLGWTCDWGGPDNFLDTAFFHFNAGKPNDEFAYGPPALLQDFQKAEQATDPATAQAAWGAAQDQLAQDLPTIPLINSQPPAAAKAYVMGFVGAGNLNEYFNSVWLNK